MSCQMSNKDHNHLVKLKSTTVDVIRKCMLQEKDVESYYNKITGGTGSCESVNTAFIMQNTPEVAFLSQTDQLSMEAEILEYDIPAIWTLGRSYRNEPRAGDGRHLSEFALLEFEAREMDLSQLLKFQQKLLDTVMEKALESSLVTDEHRTRLKKYLKNPAPVISYTDILKKLNNGGMSIQWGDDFSSVVEEAICLLFDGPVQVTHYPESIKFFNMYRSDRKSLVVGMPISEYNDNKFTVECSDFLLPFGSETFGGSQREESYDTLCMKLKESLMFQQMVQVRAEQMKYRGKTLPLEEVKELAFRPFISYLELFNPEKHPDRKSVTRSGFGLGMGRLVQFLLGKKSIVIF